MDKPKDEDCLHCILWPVINGFCSSHPDGNMRDVYRALAYVLGDCLSGDAKAERKETIAYIIDRIKARTKFVDAERRKSGDGA